MIDAEVNEGRPPSPVACDTPLEHTGRKTEHLGMSEEQPLIETCPAPDRILHLPIGMGVGTAASATLLKSGGFELIRLVLPDPRRSGQRPPPYPFSLGQKTAVIGGLITCMILTLLVPPAIYACFEPREAPGH